MTGAARGIGFALARRAMQARMRVVLADRDGEALARAHAELGSDPETVVAVRADVGIAADVERVAAEALRAFGTVHLVCNNAGVGTLGRTWEISAEEWSRVLNANLWGVIHGVRTFLPILLEHDAGAHVLNTASLAGLTSEPGLAAYRVSKHAVVALSETLRHDLRQSGSRVGVSVLCPGYVRTELIRSVRTPADLEPERAAALRDAAARAIEDGVSPEDVAEAAFDAVREGRFYVAVGAEGLELVRRRMQDILTEGAPPVGCEPRF